MSESDATAGETTAEAADGGGRPAGSGLGSLTLTELPGSDRPPARDAQPSESPLDPDEIVDVTVIVRRRSPLPDPSWRLTNSDFEQAYGADPADIDAVSARFAGLGLDVLETDAVSRRVRVSAAASLVSTVFGADLRLVTNTHPSTGQAVSHRQRTGMLSVPSDLAGVVVGVLGLDNRPQARTNLRIAAPGAVSTSYTPLELGVVYRFPDHTDGTGQTIAIIELGGGFGPSDLATYFGGLGLDTPDVQAVSVDGARNTPGRDPQGADGEVLLDIEVAGALAPKAAIRVYFAPNTDAGFIDAVSQAAHASPTPTAMSISWGQSEDGWTEQARSALDAAMADAVALGCTVTAAAGDDGSADRTTDGKAHCDFPASSPHALGCGGTTLHANGQTGAVTSETVWNNGSGNGATGGGVSDAFALPTWQQQAGVPAGSGSAAGGRGVPDVSAVADPSTGYQVFVDGQSAVYGGTSAVAPLWAALVARCAQAVGAGLGLVQPALYAGAAPGAVATGFRDVTQGDNGAFAAGPGWDACSGLGVPDGAAVLGVLQGGTTPSGPGAPA